MAIFRRVIASSSALSGWCSEAAGVRCSPRRSPSVAETKAAEAAKHSNDLSDRKVRKTGDQLGISGELWKSSLARITYLDGRRVDCGKKGGRCHDHQLQ